MENISTIFQAVSDANVTIAIGGVIIFLILLPTVVWLHRIFFPRTGIGNRRLEKFFKKHLKSDPGDMFFSLNFVVVPLLILVCIMFVWASPMGNQQVHFMGISSLAGAMGAYVRFAQKIPGIVGDAIEGVEKTKIIYFVHLIAGAFIGVLVYWLLDSQLIIQLIGHLFNDNTQPLQQGVAGATKADPTNSKVASLGFFAGMFATELVDRLVTKFNEKLKKDSAEVGDNANRDSGVTVKESHKRNTQLSQGLGGTGVVLDSKGIPIVPRSGVPTAQEGG